MTANDPKEQTFMEFILVRKTFVKNKPLSLDSFQAAPA